MSWSAELLIKLAEVRSRIGFGWQLTQDDIIRLTADWEPVIGDFSRDEWFEVVREDGSGTGVAGPRSLFHALGICHACSHIALFTLNEEVVLQRRRSDRLHWPSVWDMSVAGHATYSTPRVSPLDTAWREGQEEVGLKRQSAGQSLAGGELISIGPPYLSEDHDESLTVPLHNVEVRHVYSGLLTETGLANLIANPDEVDELHTFSLPEIRRFLAGRDISSGLEGSMPRALDWWESMGRNLFNT